MKFVDCDDIAEMLKLNAAHVRDRVTKRDGFPTTYRFGGALRWKASDVEAWIARRDGRQARRTPIEKPTEKPAGPTLDDLWARYVAEIENRPPQLVMTRDPMPVETGIYLMFGTAGEIRYVGQTVSLAHRILRHPHLWWCKRLAFIEMPDWWPWPERAEWLNAMEWMAVDYFLPPLNIADIRYAYPPKDRTPFERLWRRCVPDA